MTSSTAASQSFNLGGAFWRQTACQSRMTPSASDSPSPTPTTMRSVSVSTSNHRRSHIPPFIAGATSPRPSTLPTRTRASILPALLSVTTSNSASSRPSTNWPNRSSRTGSSASSLATSLPSWCCEVGACSRQCHRSKFPGHVLLVLQSVSGGRDREHHEVNGSAVVIAHGSQINWPLRHTRIGT